MPRQAARNGAPASMLWLRQSAVIWRSWPRLIGREPYNGSNDASDSQLRQAPVGGARTPKCSIMSEISDFLCPNCKSRYKLVRVRSEPGLPSHLIHCRVCKEPLTPTREIAALPPSSAVRAFGGAPPPTMPSADFCATIRSPCDDLSPEGHGADLPR
jgi:hypothetical protein